MKRSFKLKAFVLAMVVMMGLTLVPSLCAAEIYKNADGVTEDNAQFVIDFSVEGKTADPTTGKIKVTPGEEITVSVDLTKLPDNGYGIRSFSNRIAFDSSKIEPVVKGQNKYEQDLYDFTPGVVGTALQMKQSSLGIITGGGAVSYNGAVDPDSAVEQAGNVAKIKFRVKDDASGDIELYIPPFKATDPNQKIEGGLNVAGVKLNSNGEPVTDGKLSRYVKDGISNKLYVEVASTGVEFDGITSVELDKTNKTSMDIYQYVKKTPSNTTDTLTFESSNDKVATVDQNGIVKAVGNGTAQITVRCGANTADITVNVKTSPSSLTFKQDKYVVNFGETKNLKGEVTVGPADATYDEKDLTWSSDNTDVATVDTNGVVTAKAKGTANITAEIGNVSKSTTVSVAVPLKSISLSVSDVEVWKGETSEVTVIANPTGAEWETLATEAVSGGEHTEVTINGDKIVIKGLSEGKGSFAVSANKNNSGNDLYKLVNVTVKENKITGAVISTAAGKELLRGETLALEGTYTTQYDENDVHKTTDDTTKTWKSLNPEIATVDANGVVTAVKEGTATIELTIAGKTAQYEVTVKEIHVDGVVISDEDQKTLEALETLTVGDELRIPFTVTPEGTITDTVEEILEFIKTKFDDKLVDVKVEYDKETGKGTITVTVKAAGDVEIEIVAGDEEDEDADKYVITFKAVEPAKEEEELPETGDMQVEMMIALMAISASGIVASKKVFEK